MKFHLCRSYLEIFQNKRVQICEKQDIVQSLPLSFCNIIDLSIPHILKLLCQSKQKSLILIADHLFLVRVLSIGSNKKKPLAPRSKQSLPSSLAAAEVGPSEVSAFTFYEGGVSGPAGKAEPSDLAAIKVEFEKALASFQRGSLIGPSYMIIKCCLET
ncbi:hypothetical protein YC2023_040964 [Brassica napus]